MVDDAQAYINYKNWQQYNSFKNFNNGEMDLRNIIQLIVAPKEEKSEIEISDQQKDELCEKFIKIADLFNGTMLRQDKERKNLYQTFFQKKEEQSQESLIDEFKFVV